MTEQLDRLTAALSDRYAIQRELGAGGMATVYLADDLKHHRKVAVKVLRPELAAAIGGERFLREVDVTANLQHPHILPLFDSGEVDGFLYYVMPYVEGESLRTRLEREHELPVQESLRILREVVDALAKAHRQGVVHRDIKPDNVMLSDSHAVVTDFGVAKAVSEATGAQQLTTAGIALGTPAYMAPEQAVADPNIDHRVDIYAVGVMAYEMLAGHAPFQGPTAQSVLSQQVTETPEPVTKHRAAVGPALNAVVMKCLEKKPADRWQTAEELLHEIEQLATPSGGTAPATPVHPESRNKTRWRRAAWSAAGVAVVAVAVWTLGSFGGEEIVLDPELVAVFPFAVTGSGDVEYLHEGMVNLFESNLAGNEGVRAVASQVAIGAWRRAGGGEGTAAVPLRTARDLGAGLLIQGNLVQSGTNLVVNASLTSVIDGAESRATESGPVDSIAVIVSRLIAQLLTLRAGESTDRAAVLADVPLSALRAYLEGQIAYRAGNWEEAWERFGRAMAIDSTFALAALGHNMTSGWMLTAPPSDGLRLAWKYRERLPERDRVLLDAIRPNYPNPVSYVERFAAAERATRIIGDRVEAWYYLGDRTFHSGQLLGMTPDQVRQRTWAAFDRGLALDPTFGGIVTHKFDQALLDDDFERFRALSDSHPDVAAYHVEAELGAAIRLRDSAAVNEWFAEADSYSFEQLVIAGWFASFAGGNNEAALRATRQALAIATTESERRRALSEMRRRHWAAGQPQAAARVTERMRRELRDPLGLEAEVVHVALFLDGDSAQADAAATDIEESLRLKGMDVGSGRTFDESKIGANDIYRLCYVGLWRAMTGEDVAARAIEEQMRRFDDGDDESSRSLHARVCTLELRAMRVDPGDRATIAAQLDSIAATGPSIGARGRNRTNMVLARLYGSLGDPQRAMAVAMRVDWFDFGGYAAMLREAGRYAIAARDTAMAAHYLDWFLRPRANAEPELKAQDDELRAQLAQLLGEGGRN
ncbi:MAG: protein kinase [Gemmatimonadetes bacterium]|nr:protein kinase [Gemmatimonadota bacterium]